MVGVADQRVRHQQRRVALGGVRLALEEERIGVALVTLGRVLDGRLLGCGVVTREHLQREEEQAARQDETEGIRQDSRTTHLATLSHIRVSHCLSSHAPLTLCGSPSGRESQPPNAAGSSR